MVPTKCLSCCRRTFRTPTHDKFGATYKVKAAGRDGVQLAWLCNVMHTVFGGEHPTDIYIHSITAKRP